jgi:hypothetical protein
MSVSSDAACTLTACSNSTADALRDEPDSDAKMEGEGALDRLAAGVETPGEGITGDSTDAAEAPAGAIMGVRPVAGAFAVEEAAAEAGPGA